MRGYEESVVYRPDTSWTHAVWNGQEFVQHSAGVGFIDVYGTTISRKWATPGAMLYLWSAANPAGETACIGVHSDDQAYLVNNSGAKPLGTAFGQNCVGIYWKEDWVPVIQRSATHYSVGDELIAFPGGPTTQGFRDVRPDGSIIFGDDALWIIIGDVMLAKPMTRGFVTVGQVDGTDRIDGVRRVVDVHGRITFERFASIPGPAFEPHVDTDGHDNYIIVARTGKGAATNLHPPFLAAEPVPEPIPERPTCTITSYPETVKLGEGAVCGASYGGGPATKAVWQYRSLGEVIWVTDAEQTPPLTQHTYQFLDAGTFDISLRVEGPGGFDETATQRRITVTKDVPGPEPGRLSVAFGPNVGSLDFQQLGTESNLWSGYTRASAFHFYLQNIINRVDVDHLAGPNTYEAMRDSGLIRKVAEWGMLTEVELAGPPDQVHEAQQLIADAGGRLDVLMYDGTYKEISVQDFADWVKQLRSEYPWIIGCYTAFPMTSADGICARVDAWNALGVRPNFLRMDVDPNPTQDRQYTTAVHAQIRRLCDDYGIGLQYVVNAVNDLSDAEYCKRAWEKYQRFEALGGWTGRIVQSWAGPDKGPRTIPNNLPESDSSKFTALLVRVLDAEAAR